MTEQTIASIIEQACRDKGDTVFLSDEELRLTGTELWRDINKAATGLSSLGLGKGDVVGFLCGSSVRHALVTFACYVSGIIPCSLHVRETPDRNANNLKFIGARILFADPDQIDLAERLADQTTVGRLIPLSASPSFDALLSNESPGDAVYSPAPDDRALLVMSSGTTGDPKCVIQTQATLAATARIGPYVYDCWSAEEKAVIIMAPSFAAWIFSVLPFLYARTSIHFGKALVLPGFLETLQAERITIVPFVPTLWRMVLAEKIENYDLSAIKMVFFSGEPGSESLIDDLRDHICANVRTAYLASEAGCASAVVAGSDILTVAGQAASTGKPVPGAMLRIVDPDGGISDELPAGKTGEITLKSDSVSPGYFGNPDLSAEKLVDGWWRSGDLGYINENGVLFVKGRLDNRINTGGIKIHAEEIEAALSRHPAIKLAAVVGEPDERWGERIEAHLISDDPGITGEDILDYCRDNDLLPRTFLPKAIHFHDSLPTGPTGKLFRRGLKADG
ncbi:MAG: class I adenylate-forming enzyme family protein [Proteobacteria bacterium]|nr:class I adenylate-forming enzyme family protein [Pseudomonadota bacterium]